MFEVELKFRRPNGSDIVEQLRTIGARQTASHVEEDHYFNAPDRDYRQTDEAFRLRRIGTENHLTYKGPKHDTTTKTRTEIEARLADGEATADNAIRLVEALGYRPVAVVRKRRTIYQLQAGEITTTVSLDEVDGVGSFVEVEVVADAVGLEAAQKNVHAVAAKLGLAQIERRSYLALLLAMQTGSNG